MGIGFTLDTPVKVAHLGIDSVISLVDDILQEKMRKFYCEKFGIPCSEISDKTSDFRAKRITAYLNLMQQIARKKFNQVVTGIAEKSSEGFEFISLLPDTSAMKHKLSRLYEVHFQPSKIRKWVSENLSMGSIDVNIMTKVDRENYFRGKKLPIEFNDAHAAVRGFALSDLDSTLILSAGMNPKLYNYLEQFEDFYPDATGAIKKKIALKVSDYRSAFIQGKYLANKGLWVSEFRIESGLNCGGHAFATDGFLMGPILAEFRDKREELSSTLREIYCKALTVKKRQIPATLPAVKITAQGGVGTASEHQFLLEHYQLESIGWGTPFLLVPEATTVDEPTLRQLQDAQEDDLYTSDTSPLGVPFNTLKNNTKDLEKTNRIEKGKPGSPCPKKYVALNREFSEKGSCTASRHYQNLKIGELKSADLSPEAYQEEYEKIVEKSCICVGLGTSALLVNDLDTRVEGTGVSVCPGPNLAYFSAKMKLKEILDHIYGRLDMISRNDRPHMFIKELNLYVDFLKKKMAESRKSDDDKRDKYLKTFIHNLNEGIQYYHDLFSGMTGWFEDKKSAILNELEASRKMLQLLLQENQNFQVMPATRLPEQPTRHHT